MEVNAYAIDYLSTNKSQILVSRGNDILDDDYIFASICTGIVFIVAHKVQQCTMPMVHVFEHF